MVAPPTNLPTLWAVLDDFSWSPTADSAAELLSRGQSALQLIKAHQLLKITTTASENDSALRQILAKWRAAVNGLVHAKAAPARAVGMALAVVWMEQAPSVLSTTGSAWASVWLATVTRPSDPRPLRHQAAGALITLLRTARSMPDLSRDVVTPTVPKLVAVLVQHADLTISIRLQALTDLLAAFPSACRSAIDKIRVLCLAHLDSHADAASKCYARSLAVVAAPTKGSGAARLDAAGQWTHAVRATVVSMHATLDVLFEGVDEDWATPADTPALTLPTLSTRIDADTYRVAIARLESLATLLSAVVRHPVPTTSLALPVTTVVDLAARILAASAAYHDPSRAQFATAYGPVFRSIAVGPILRNSLLASVPPRARHALAPHAYTLVTLTHRALASATRGSLDLLADLVDAVGFPACDRIWSAKLPGRTSTFAADLADQIRTGSNAAVCVVHAALAAHGARIPTYVRAPWDHALLARALDGDKCGLVADALVVSAAHPSVIAARGVGAYRIAPLAVSAVVDRRVGSSAGAAAMDAIAHPRYVVGAAPVKVVLEKDQEKQQMQVEEKVDNMVVDPTVVAAQAVAAATAATMTMTPVAPAPAPVENVVKPVVVSLAAPLAVPASVVVPSRSVVAPPTAAPAPVAAAAVAPTCAPVASKPVVAPVPIPAAPARAAPMQNEDVEMTESSRPNSQSAGADDDDDDDELLDVEIVDACPDSDDNDDDISV
ncbi:hypothetical protein AMAG_05178 [Allomyces macrogynus ATCC 38327]|uniref:Pre-rRNA-processing protein RIX1 n=1 Tax=Allomyces macrogynus (strain ATCC 38327) TaxID=578462 RepID=A0A0L0SAW1_ALLM3|nr:hypothetical protein AMAG_05178 [Allomyces macrogynus ATCC 38327]|eukprot:KNE59713.1 hypothetical protein AMAG_05178 [Allomyces macrogynus ATCC 38327]